MCVCLFAFFSAISKPIGKPFSTKLHFAPEEVLKQIIKFFFIFRTVPGAIGKFVPKGFPIGFEMAEKNLNRQTDNFVFI